MNQFIESLALLPAEKIINTLLARDPHITRQLSKFDSKCVEVIGRHPTFTLSLRFEDDGIKLSAIDSKTLGIRVDATISGSAASLLTLLAKDSEHRALSDADIEISGDATLIQDLQVTIDSLDIDWQDYLSPLLGDVLSNELGELQRGMREWSRSAGSKLERNISDYLSEEARLVPSALEVESFSNRLDHLRLDIDRASAKTELLKRRAALLAQAK